MTQPEKLTNIIDGNIVAKYVKYFLQLKNPYIVYKIPFDRVSSKTFYNNHKVVFDKICKIFKKYDLKIEKYLEFFILKQNKFEKDIDSELISVNSIRKYLEHLQIYELHKKIYSYYLKSVKNIVNDCILLGYNNVLDYLRYLISNRLLSNYYVSGKISNYYFASIPNFKKVIEKLDQLSKDEFSVLYDRFDKYNVDINEAFMQMKNIRINTISYTNDMILKAKNV